MNLKQTLISSLALLMTLLVPVLAPSMSFAASCGVPTAIINCPNVNNNATDTSQTGAWQLLIIALNIMTAGVGIAGVGGIVFGALLYTTAGDKAEQTKRAVGIIVNVVIGLVAYGLMYVGLNFLIPGGVFTS